MLKNKRKTSSHTSKLSSTTTHLVKVSSVPIEGKRVVGIGEVARDVVHHDELSSWRVEHLAVDEGRNDGAWLKTDAVDYDLMNEQGELCSNVKWVS